VRQELDHDEVSLAVQATPAALYDLVADITRTPEFSPNVVRARWIGGATGPAMGARFKAYPASRWSGSEVVFTRLTVPRRPCQLDA
jgi:Polyketide cyclase / dehydrase and lipid transport